MTGIRIAFIDCFDKIRDFIGESLPKYQETTESVKNVCEIIVYIKIIKIREFLLRDFQCNLERKVTRKLPTVKYFRVKNRDERITSIDVSVFWKTFFKFKLEGIRAIPIGWFYHWL